MFCDIQHHNRAHISDITFKNINCEYTKHQLSDTYQHDMSAPFEISYPARHPVLINAAIYDMGLFSKDGLHGDICDIKFRNIHMLTDGDSIPEPIIILCGLDESHRVENVSIDAIYRDGIRLEHNGIEWHINEYARKIKFI